jgi:hypothetical protein
MSDREAALSLCGAKNAITTKALHDSKIHQELCDENSALSLKEYCN